MLGNILLSTIFLFNSLCFDINIKQVKTKICDNYYKKIPDSIKGLEWNHFKRHLDPYTRVLDSSETIDFDKEMQNKADGVIGITSDSVKGGFKVIETINEGDAYAKGIIRGDIITKIDGRIPKTNAEFSSMVRGKVGTKVKLEILRNKKTLNFILERSFLFYRNVHSQKLYKTAIINIETFHNLASVEFLLHSVATQENTIDTLIIDVRNNPGGLLNECLKISDEFFDSNFVLLTRIGENEFANTYSIKGGRWIKNKTIIVLQDEWSASASELLSASLKYGRGAIVVGKTSYGKGLVQSQFDIDGGRLFVTTSEYFPLGFVKIDGVGVIPDKKMKTMNYDTLSGNIDIKLIRKLYPKPSLEALNNPMLKGKKNISHLIWEKDGELFEVLLQKPYN